MAHEFTASYLNETTSLLRYYKQLAERAMAQAPDEVLGLTLDPESNSIATIVKHLAGNMRSRWSEFLISDGEKEDRNRDREFEAPPRTRVEVMQMWEKGWSFVFNALEQLTEPDLVRTVRIRAEPHSVMQAISRQVAHYSYHIGQIVYLAKHFSGPQWTSLTIPRGKSAEFSQGARLSSGRGNNLT